ncbi:hypothetical protein QSG27_27810, partial [Azospirillum sp. C340-1]|nr:hypothetical protein [Azospirillum isscasi]
MALTVLTVASPFAPVGADPESEGTAEQVAGAIDAALVRAGHRSVVIAPEDSAVAGTLIPLARVHGGAHGQAPDERAQAAGLRRGAAVVAGAVAEHAPGPVHIPVRHFR